MHQPFYKDLISGEAILPWVRLHAIKDYYDMLVILEKFPNVHMTFNYVPSLLLQLENYITGNITDKMLELTKKDVNDLEESERILILRNFFMCNWDTMAKPYPRYYELLLKRGRYVTTDDLLKSHKRMSKHDITDLQVWFNLAWFGNIYKKNDPVISSLIEKGRNFTQEDKTALIDKQYEIMKMILPKLIQMQNSGQIEVSITPFYHPILPLLADTNIASMAIPDIKLPKHRFTYPQDASYQIIRAVEFYRERFGKDPAGMWPSEGSVSHDIIPLIADAGIKWIATDEDILSRSIHVDSLKNRIKDLYKPYRIENSGKSLNIIFRDHYLSDLVGFVYQKWGSHDAALDLIKKLEQIKAGAHGNPALVSIILDGENAWEFYNNNGEDFLNDVYQRISNISDIKAVTVSEYLNMYPPTDNIPRLFAGSWINNNFRIWIGHDEDNIAWDYLWEARQQIEKMPPPDNEETRKKRELAWQEIYIAEGSDWCWWFGDDHSSENDEEFDLLFRKHLTNVYIFLGMDPPKYLENPIKHQKIIKSTRDPIYLISPKIDGETTDYYEWISAGAYDVDMDKGAMHQINSILQTIYYGFDFENLYFRLDTNISMLNPENREFVYNFYIVKPHPYRAQISYNQEKQCYESSLFRFSDSKHWEKVKDIESFCVGRIIEIGLSFSDIAINLGDDACVSVIIGKDGGELERWPRGGLICFSAPTEDYEARFWKV